MSKDSFLEMFRKQNEGRTAPKGKPKFPLKFIPNAPVIDRTVEGDVGLEIEVEGMNLPNGNVVNLIQNQARTVAWVTHQDGSLRETRGHPPYEYVLSAPASIDDVPELVTKLMEAFTNNGSEIVNSNRTSIHAHINVQGMKVNELTSFIILWSMFEDAFIRWCGDVRKSNHFCLSNKDTGSWLVNTWLRGLNEGRLSWDNNVKYNALNLGALRRFGSFEFRCMRGIETVEQVVNWCNLLYALREEAKGEYRVPSDIVNRISEMTPIGFLRDIFTRYNDKLPANLLEQLVGTYADEREFEDAVFENLRDAQALSYLINWKEWEESFYAPYVKNPFMKQKAPKVRDLGLRNAGEMMFQAGRIVPAPRPEIDEFFDEDGDE